MLSIDDGLLISKSRVSIDVVIKALKQHFEITLGDASLFVGLQIEHNREKKLCSYTNFVTLYTQQLLEKFNMSNAKPVSVYLPQKIDPNANLSSNDSDNSSIIVSYREAIGSLIFLAQATRAKNSSKLFDSQSE